MFWAIEFLAKNIDKHEQYVYLYKIFNELWYEYHFYINNEKKIKRQVATAITILPNIIDERKVDIYNDVTNYIEIKRIEKKWNFYCIIKELHPNTVYKLNIKIFESDCEKFTIIFKDTLYNIVIKEKVIPKTEEAVIYFITEKDINNIELRIYPNQPEFTENHGLKAYVELNRLEYQ